jgi:hypothetical protein
MTGVVDRASGAAFADAALFMMLFPCAYCLWAISATVSARVRIEYAEAPVRVSHRWRACRVQWRCTLFHDVECERTQHTQHLVLLANEKGMLGVHRFGSHHGG